MHIYHGASRTTGKLALLQGKNAAKNDRTLAEIILDSPLFLAFGDKLILRSGDTKTLMLAHECWKLTRQNVINELKCD